MDKPNIYFTDQNFDRLSFLLIISGHQISSDIHMKLFAYADTSFNPLQPSVAFLYPLKTSEKPLDFLMFSGGIEKQHRAVMS